jgi:hypothetical protein
MGMKDEKEFRNHPDNHSSRECTKQRGRFTYTLNEVVFVARFFHGCRLTRDEQ